MSVILKHRIELQLDPHPIQLTVMAKILYVGAQNGDMFMWVLHYDNLPPEERWFRVAATGQPIKGLIERQYVGTIQVFPHVWHIFEAEKP